MTFTAPVKPGSLARFDSKIVFTGSTRIVAFIRLSVNEIDVVKGFITFINVDSETKPLPHGIVIEPASDEDQDLFELASKLK